MKIIRNIIESETAPDNGNSLWLNKEGELLSLNNGKWTPVSKSSPTPIPTGNVKQFTSLISTATTFPKNTSVIVGSFTIDATNTYIVGQLNLKAAPAPPSEIITSSQNFARIRLRFRYPSGALVGDEIICFPRFGTSTSCKISIVGVVPPEGECNFEVVAMEDGISCDPTVVKMITIS